MRGRIYTVPTALQTVTNAGGDQDIASAVAAATSIIALRGVAIGQSSEFGDAADEQLQVIVKRAVGGFTIGSGGAAVTPVPVDQEGAASSFTARRNDTTIATGGTITDIHTDAFNVRAGYQLWFPDGFEPIASPTDALIVEISGPADDITMGCTLYVEEVGT
jgi:hypothetical protein